MRNLIGTKKFYRQLFAISLPIMLQQLITAAVQLVDNLMVGSLGESAIGAISVVNTLFFVVTLLNFGVMSGAGIYAAQFFGAKDFEKLQQTFAFKLITGFVIGITSFIGFTFWGRDLIGLFTENETTIQYGLDYLKIVRFNVFLFVVFEAIRSSFRDIGITKSFLYVSTVAIFVNTVLNYILIFGSFGAPELGVEGAAIATVIARVVEMLLGIVLLLKTGELFYRSPRSLIHIRLSVFKSILIIALPLMANEFLWSMGQTAFLKAYSTRGDEALAAMNITSVISQLIFISFMAMGTAASVMVGKKLGENKLEEAKDNSVKIAAFAVALSLVTGLLLIIVSFFVVDIYNVSESTKAIAEFCIRANVFITPFYAYNVVIYFTLRSGGDIRSTLMLDAAYTWFFAVPIAFLLAYVTILPVTIMFMIVQGLEIPKSFFSTYRYKRGKWVRNLAVDAE